MGANVSKTRQTINRELINQLSNSCEASNDIIQVFENNKIIVTDSDCKNIVSGNQAKAVANCDSDSISKLLSSYSGELTEEQMAGLGFNITDTQTDIQGKIKSIIESSCGSSTKIKQTLNNSTLEISNSNCDLAGFMNKADASSSCIAKLVNDTLDQIETKTTKTSKGFLSDPLVWIMLILGIIILVLIIFFFGSE